MLGAISKLMIVAISHKRPIGQAKTLEINLGRKKQAIRPIAASEMMASWVSSIAVKTEVMLETTLGIGLAIIF